MNPGAMMQKSLHHERRVVNGRLCYLVPRRGHRERGMAEEISRSLRRRPRSIHPKFFYDRRGSELFEQICGLPEYYPARTETGILSRIKGELSGLLGGDFRLVELGSGSSVKTRHVLDVLHGSQPAVEYIPIDISESLVDSSRGLLGRYPGLSIVGIIDTYENGLELVRGLGGPSNLVAFFGSSFGNFPFGEGARFLRSVRDSMGGGDLFLMGLDLVKERGVLEAAYDDAQGVTARFNLNVLERINRDLGADFDLGGFSHHSVYNEAEQRVEMYVRSLRDQRVTIPGADLSLALEEGELVHTENSHKFSIPQIGSLMGESGFEILRLWQDPGAKFAVLLLARS